MKFPLIAICFALLSTACKTDEDGSSLHDDLTGRDTKVDSRDTIIDLKESASLNSLSAILFNAIDLYATTPRGALVVIYGPREAALTSVNLRDKKRSVSCERFATNGEDRYSCTLKNITDDDDNIGDSESVAFDLLWALDNFAQKNPVGGKNVIFFARETFAVELMTREFDGESISCSGIADERFSCGVSR